jgi:hypothetical protein
MYVHMYAHRKMLERLPTYLHTYIDVETVDGENETSFLAWHTESLKISMSGHPYRRQKDTYSF